MLRLRTAGVKKGVWGRDESRGAHRHGSSRPSWKELGERSSATRSPLAPSADTRDPLHAGHLENLLRLARLGAIIAPRSRPSTSAPNRSTTWPTTRSAASSTSSTSTPTSPTAGARPITERRRRGSRSRWSVEKDVYLGAPITAFSTAEQSPWPKPWRGSCRGVTVPCSIASSSSRRNMTSATSSITRASSSLPM